MSKVNILSTKILLSPQKQALLDAGFSVNEANFIKTQNLDFDLKGIKANLIFTSQNAAQSVLLHPKAEDLKTKNVFCVGIKTKALLEENGFNVIVYVDYASDLAEIITLIYSNETYTFFSGNLRKETVPKALKEANIQFNEIQVYETILTPHKLNIAVEGILFFSPSGVESYLKENKIKKEVCFCIGETTAEALFNVTKNIRIAENPSIEELILEVIEYY
ncbi:uroporphyrinogen-III synthase [Flavobacterium sp.]|uniref:uroporphyrinogen-III synthase n=1 Tax=Flavobacterium sp. TaxID=239 RepID=UPI00286A827A|nr:uroporphyrinogen-III synthase [Flavobacterium sp.]